MYARGHLTLGIDGPVRSGTSPPIGQAGFICID